MLKRAISLGVEHDGAQDLQVTRAMNTLGLYLQQNKRLEEALTIQRQILNNVAIGLGKEHETYAQSLNNLGTTLMGLERFDEAEHTFKEAIAIGEKLPPDTLAMADWLSNFAVLRGHQHQTSEADALYRRALGILYRASARAGSDLPHLPVTIQSYTTFLRATGWSGPQISERLEYLRRGEDVPAL